MMRPQGRINQSSKERKMILSTTKRREFISKCDLAFIGNNTNWDIYLGSGGTLWSVPKLDKLTDCHLSIFGDSNHIKQLISEGLFHDTPTELGLELLNGLISPLATTNNYQPAIGLAA
jgi:hypothetical protein